MSEEQPVTALSTEAGRRLFDVLHRMGLAHAENGTVGTEIATLEREAVADLRASLAAEVRGLDTSPLPSEGFAMVNRAAVLRLIEGDTDALCGGCIGPHKRHNQYDCLRCTCKWQMGVKPGDTDARER